MPRLFVAIEMSESVKQALVGLKTDIPTARWVKPEQMHLTLRFIGADVPDDKVEPIKAALNTIKLSTFDLSLQGVGRFPPNPKKAPRVIWVGIHAPPELTTLHRQVSAALKTVGFKPDRKPFTPHITLARLKSHRPSPQADRFLERHHNFDAGTFTVSEFALIRSELSPQGAVYTHESVYTLST